MKPDIALTLDLAAQSPASLPTRLRFPAWLASLTPIERQAFGRLHALAVEHLRSAYSINPQLPGWLGWANAMARQQFEESSMPKDTPTASALDGAASAAASSSAPGNLDLF